MFLKRMFQWLRGESQPSATEPVAESSSEEIARNAQAVAQSAVEIDAAGRQASEAMAEAAETVAAISAFEALKSLPLTPVDELIDEVMDTPLRGPMKNSRSDEHPRDEWIRTERRSKSQKRKGARSSTERRLRKRREAKREFARR